MDAFTKIVQTGGKRMTKTTTTYYCDRCGERMEEHPVFFCSTHPDTAIQILINGEWEYADICDKCKESFRTWWEKSSTSPTEVEELRRILLERDDEMISFRQLVNRFDSVEKEYPDQPWWNLMQIYNNFNILIGEKLNNWNWISVLDKLPEKEGLYIVTRENSWGSAIVDTSYWFKSKTNNHGFNISDRVVAWMSVEPYKQEVEE